MNSIDKDTRPLCKYGEKCYQKNQNHLKRFSHPHSINLEKRKLEENGSLQPAKKIKEDQGESSKEIKIVNSFSLNDSSDECVFLDSKMSIEERIKLNFLVDMPKDFYDFWNFCQTVNAKSPQEALVDVELRLVGPFDLLSNKWKSFKNPTVDKFLCHWRYYYDPPEFQTVVAGEKDEFHIGYFRDDPSDKPVFLASMSSQKPGIVQPLKKDIFATLHSYLTSPMCKTSENQKSNLMKKLEIFAKEKNYDLDASLSDYLKERRKIQVSKSFHGAGIVVPVDAENDVGYREIPETDADLKRMLKKISNASSQTLKEHLFEPLHELMRNAQWATDEGDFGMGIELGLDLFCFGGEDFHSFIGHLLSVNYELLNRSTFAKIIKAHLKNRRKGSNMSAFDEDS